MRTAAELAAIRERIVRAVKSDPELTYKQLEERFGVSYEVISFALGRKPLANKRHDHKAKTSPEVVEEIRRQWRAGVDPDTLAAKYGLSRATITRFGRGRE